MQHLEGIVGRRLVVLVVRNQAAAIIGGEDLRRLEMLAREAWSCRNRTAPISTTRESSGMVTCIADSVSKTPICVGEPTTNPPAQPAESALCSQSAPATRFAQSWNSARVHSKRWSWWRNLPAGSVSHFTLYSRFGVVSTIVAGRAHSNSTRSNAAKRGGSRCSMTSTTAAASNPASRWSRYISEPCSNWRRSRLHLAAAGPGAAGPWQSPARDARRPCRRFPSNCLFLQQRLQQSSFAAAQGREPAVAPLALQCCQHRAESLFVQADALLDWRLFLRVSFLRFIGIGSSHPPAAREHRSSGSDWCLR